MKKLRAAARKAEREHPFTVAANLAFQWYDAIEAGRKRTEYRDISPYWTNHLFKNGDICGQRAGFIKFSRGYTKKNMTWAIRRIDISEEEGCYMIRLGRQISWRAWDIEHFADREKSRQKCRAENERAMVV